MEASFRAIVIITMLLVPLGCKSAPTHSTPRQSLPPALKLLDQFVANACYEPELPRGEQITPAPDEIVNLLRRFKKEETQEHFPFLLEYGLKLHWINLQHTGVARELPLENNLVVSELIRLAGIPKYNTAHEAGWLNSQFYGKFKQTGWSSYQIYIYIKEQWLFTWDFCPNLDRINAIVRTVDTSDRNGVGGANVCHYG